MDCPFPLANEQARIRKDRASQLSFRSLPQALERRLVRPLSLRAASQASSHPFSFPPSRQVWLPLLLEPQSLALLFAVLAWSLSLQLASSAPALLVWPELVPQVSAVFAKLASPESAPRVLQEPMYPVLQQGACLAWQVVALLGQPYRPRNFRWTMQASLVARAS